MFNIFKMQTNNPTVLINGITSSSFPNGLRQGMWVMHGNKIGILNGRKVQTNPEDGAEVELAEVHYVDNISGETLTAVFVPYEELTQAGFDDIPQGRKPEKQKAARMGYK